MKNLLNRLIAFFLDNLERLIDREIVILKSNKRGDIAVKSSAKYLYETARYIDQISSFKPKNVFEIGANYGQDSVYLKNCFGLKDKDIFIFEPHPYLFKKLKKLYNFNCYNFAVSNQNKKVKLHAIDLTKNNGMSSLRFHKVNDKKIYKDILVQSIRMDRFIINNNIKSIDFLKIDVEGLTFEVLLGFGSFLHIVKSIQLETEFLPMWQGQKTYERVFKLLEVSKFQLIDYRLQEDGVQSDSFWIRKDLVDHKIYNSSNKKWKKIHLHIKK